MYMLCVFDCSSLSHHATNNLQQSTLMMPVKFLTGKFDNNNTIRDTYIQVVTT